MLHTPHTSSPDGSQTNDGLSGDVLTALSRVKDPEIPVISIVEMGMVTRAEKIDNTWHVTITPTFVGCPAINMIKDNIVTEMQQSGMSNVTVHVDFDTQWNSDRISPEAREKLEKFGLAPPPMLNDEDLTPEQLDRVRCPHCGSTDTTLRSAFGSTLCRAIRFCFNCKQGFEQFKPVG